MVALEAGEGERIARIEYTAVGLFGPTPRFAIDDLVMVIPEPVRALIELTSLAMLAVLWGRVRFRER